jgi:hypothetical protein
MGQVFGKTGVAEPAHAVLFQHRAAFEYEIRRYGVRFAAQTKYKDDDDSPFMILARYIGVFGTPENEGNEAISMTAPVIKETKSSAAKIAMTAPVVMSETSSGEKEMSFILPAEFDSYSKIPKVSHCNALLIRKMCLLRGWALILI